MPQPKTNASLLIRVRDSNDNEAWEEFASIYRPAIMSLAQHKGMQNADAEDLAQQVLISVSKSIRSWQPDPNRASFRTWLNRVTHNAVINAITRAAPDRASGNTQVMNHLNESAANGSCDSNPDSQLLTVEIRRQVFRYAANEIQSEFQTATWQAFWLTAIEGFSIEDIAKRLEKNMGSIYAARSRVMRRLKEKVQELQLLDSKETND